MDGDQAEIDEERGDPEANRHRAIHAVMSLLVALGVLIGGAGLALVFWINKVEAEQEEPEQLVPTVRVQPIEEMSHEVEIETQGVVESRREVSLAAEVSGRVVSISPELVEGGAVDEGDVLVAIEDGDYQAAVAESRATLADARLTLEQEKARATQAEEDWKKLGRGEPSSLARREPQIASAEARIDAAAAQVERAERNLQRTEIRAPFAGRVRSAQVEVGAVVAAGTTVAELYSDTELEVRLPFSLRDFGYLRGPDTPEFMLRATLGAESEEWPAKIARVEGEVERETLSGYGIARVLPADADPAYPPVGLFVEATVPGETLNGVIEVPRSAVREQNQLWVVAEGRLRGREIEVLRARRETLIIRGDFAPSERLVLTRLETPVEGMEVRVEPETPTEGE